MHKSFEVGRKKAGYIFKICRLEQKSNRKKIFPYTCTRYAIKLRYEQWNDGYESSKKPAMIKERE